MFGLKKTTGMPAADAALPGRSESMPVPEKHFVNGHPLTPPFPEGLETAMFGLGCFWGLSVASGRQRAFTRRQWVMREATHLTPAIKKCVPE